MATWASFFRTVGAPYFGGAIRTGLGWRIGDVSFEALVFDSLEVKTETGCEDGEASSFRSYRVDVEWWNRHLPSLKCVRDNFSCWLHVSPRTAI